MARRLQSMMRNFGHTPRHVLPAVAITLAEKAAAGEVDADDTIDLYIDYFAASAGVTKVEPSDPSVRANASKLRQIIKAADPTLLRKATKMTL